MTTQEKRQIAVTTPLGQDTLLFRRLAGRSQFSHLFSYDLELLSTDANIEISDLLGKPLGLRINIEGQTPRHLHGHVSRFVYGGMRDDFHIYHAQLRPWLWFLTRTANCRIFQNQSIPGIVEELLREQGFSEFEFKLSGDYPQEDYCTQYNETTFDFISRLLEKAGIYYFFQHDENKHRLILSDSHVVHETRPGVEEIPCRLSPEEQNIPYYVYNLVVGGEFTTGTFSARDYDFERPRTDLSTRRLDAHHHPAQEDYEHFSYPGGYKTTAQGDTLLRNRAEAFYAQANQIEAETNTPRLEIGDAFALNQHPRDALNRQYTVVSAEITLESDAYRGRQQSSNEPVYHCQFTAIENDKNYKSPHRTPRPFVHGPQTAVVVGPEGEKIWTDQYGRVKVQFHWDRLGNNNENSSCWIRLAHNRAGKNWGDFQLPHIGQEVVVSFLEGDPDHPLITGHVYNADHMPPEALPDNQHKTVMRDDHGNEIIMDATPGDEHIRLYAPNHHSGIELGRSIKSWCDEDAIQISEGNTGSIGWGTNFSIFGGASGDIKGGFSGSIGLGLDLGFSLIGSHKYDLGYSYTWNLLPVVTYSRADVLTCSRNDLIVSAGDQLCLAGGGFKKPAAADQMRSIVNIFPESIQLSVGDDTKHLDQSRNFAGAAEDELFKSLAVPPTLTYFVPAFVFGIASAILTGFALSKASDSRENPWGFGGFAIATAALTVVTALIFQKNNLRDKKIEPVKHDGPKTSIFMDDKKITLGDMDPDNKKKATKISLHNGEKNTKSTITKVPLGIFIRAGQSELTIGKDGSIIIHSESKDIKFVTKGGKDLDLTEIDGKVKFKSGNVSIDDKDLKLRTGITHKYLAVAK